MLIVPAVTTPITAEQARVALVAAMPGIDGDTGTLLLALIWIETANGHLQNWNPGNITASDKWPGAAWRPPWFTVDASSPPIMVHLHELMLRGKAPSAFRAYDSLLEGFLDFARVLRSMFPSVLAAAATGDAAKFVTALHDSGYSKDYSPAHVPHMVHLQQQLAPQFAGFPKGHRAADALFGFTGEIAIGALAAIIAGVALHNWHHKPRRRRAAARH